MKFTELSYPSADGIHTVHAAEWAPDVAPTAMLQIVHGIAEHIRRYDRLAEVMADAGILVFAEDHLGHGGTSSGDERGSFAESGGWELVCRDVAQLASIEREKHDIPYFLLGHSMGSFLARTVFINGGIRPDGLILSGTGHQSAAVIAAGRAVAKAEKRRIGGAYPHSDRIDSLAFGAYNKRFAPNRTGYDWISSDPGEVDEYMSDPDCGFSASIPLFLDMLDGLRYIGNKKNIRNAPVDVPVLLISGGDDPVGGMGKGVKRVADDLKSCGVKDVTLEIFPGARHELLREPLYRDKAFAYILDFIQNNHQTL